MTVDWEYSAPRSKDLDARQNGHLSIDRCTVYKNKQTDKQKPKYPSECECKREKHLSGPGTDNSLRYQLFVR